MNFQNLIFRKAAEADLPGIIEMLKMIFCERFGFEVTHEGMKLKI